MHHEVGGFVTIMLFHKESISNCMNGNHYFSKIIDDLSKYTFYDKIIGRKRVTK